MNTASLTPFERCLKLSSRIEPGDGRRVAAVGLLALVLMTAYYLLRPVREALILTEGSAELRSYAGGVQALLLVAFIPLYGALVRRVGARHVLRTLAMLAALQLVLFSGLAYAGITVGFAFFVWVGLFGVLMVAQFWALATDLFTVDSGQRLFGVLAAAIAAGAWLGARLASAGFPLLGPCGLMLASAALLGLTALVHAAVLRTSAPGAPAIAPWRPANAPGPAIGHWLGGLALIVRTPWLAAIALLVVLLNWITSAGEFVLADWLAERARTIAPGTEAAYIGQFMGHYSATISLTGFLVQVFIVSRVIRAAGLGGALLATPALFAAGFLAASIVPLFAVLECVMIAQRSLDYSLFGTTRSALLLAASREAKYHAKTAIDTVCYRIGDLLASLSIFAGVRLYAVDRREMLGLALALSLALAFTAWRAGRDYRRRAAAYHPHIAEGEAHDDDRRPDDAAGQPALSGPVSRRPRQDRRTHGAATLSPG